MHHLLILVVFLATNVNTFSPLQKIEHVQGLLQLQDVCVFRSFLPFVYNMTGECLIV